MDQLPPGRTSYRASVGLLAAALLLLGGYTLWPFLSALVWAGIFAIALWPLYRRATAQLGDARARAWLPPVFTLAVALVFLVPLGVVATQLAREAHAGADWVRQARERGVPEPEALHHLPFAQEQVDAWWEQNLAEPEGARKLVQGNTQGRFADLGRVVGAQVARRVTLFAFTLLTLFFLFREARAVTTQLRRAASRAFGPHGERIGLQIIASVHGTVSGLVLVGLGEGVVLGVVYAIAGVPHATVLGALTALAAMIPLAAYAVFTLAALLVAADGSTAWGIAVFVIGVAVAFFADHAIRPALIGGATRLPFLWVLLGILGGLEMWGLLGLFLGPAIMAALMLLWREWVDDSVA